MKRLNPTSSTLASLDKKYANFRICYYEDVTDEWLMELFDGVEKVRDKRGRLFLNCPAAFDIETTSIKSEHGRHATMYHWQMLINKTIILGRTWDEFFDVIDMLTSVYLLPERQWLAIYVHNLSYEFQFIRKFFDWRKVFARAEKRPIYADTTTHIEFRCSYMLSNSGLGKLTSDYGFEVAKEKDYDYEKPRHCKTPMTLKEIKYCINDVASMYYYIQSEMKRNENDITKIPATQTAYVRRALKDKCYPESEPYVCKEYHEMMSELTLTAAEYESLKRAYSGGFSHANVTYVGDVQENVYSYDIASSYPTVICSEKFPMSASQHWEKMSLSMYRKLMIDHNIVADFVFENICAKPDAPEHYIQRYKCFGADGKRLRPEHGTLHDCLEDNNRIIEAPYLGITLTEIDFQIIDLYYNFDSVVIYNAYVYESAFLPKALVSLCIELYAAKTQLKNVEGKEEEYLHAKEMLNSNYGMMVTDILQDEVLYTDGEWGKKKADCVAGIEKYNNQKRRTLFYPWGVYVTAYARRNLMYTIWAMGDDYIYSDTDSVKILNPEKHLPYFAKYNETITNKIEHVLNARGIDPLLAVPIAPDMTAHPLGHFELDAVCIRFKTLGSKRYLYTTKDKLGQEKLHMTVAGVDKKRGCEYLEKTFKDPFAAFNFGLCYPKEYSGKMIATYTDEPINGELDDGETVEEYEELSCVHIEAADYNMDASEDFLNLLGFHT